MVIVEEKHVKLIKADCDRLVLSGQWQIIWPFD